MYIDAHFNPYVVHNKKSKTFYICERKGVVFKLYKTKNKVLTP